MDKPLFWQIKGQGCDLVLIHGWGMNGAVFEQIAEDLSQFFCVHTVDLPGFGWSQQTYAYSFESLCEQVVESAPPQAVYVGWSLGGLIATQIALMYPERVTHLVSLASSPKFAADETWKGIPRHTLAEFSSQLTADYQKTIEGFMGLQVMGSPFAKQEINQIKQAVFSRPAPNIQALTLGLECLKEVDLRDRLKDLTMPYLRLYGRLDRLVPKVCALAVLPYTPKSQAYIFEHSSHAPFITQREAFTQVLIDFITCSSSEVN